MFEITVNENRNYRHTASYVGFQPKHVIARPGQNASITLFPSRTNLNEVVVTGTRSDRPLKDMPVLTRVISRARNRNDKRYRPYHTAANGITGIAILVQ